MMLPRFLPAVLAVGFAVAARAAGDPAPKPDFTTTAEELMKEVAADPKAAAAKYDGKHLAVTGPLSFSDPRWLRGRDFSLYGGKKKPTDMFGLFVEGRLPPGEGTGRRYLVAKQKVELAGRVVLVEAHRVVLTGCTLTPLEKVDLSEVAAADLGAAFDREVDGAAKKYGGPHDDDRKQMILTGTVREVKKPGEYVTEVVLDTPSKLGVTLELWKDEAAGLKPGDKVRANAHCWGVAWTGYQQRDQRVRCHGLLLPASDGKNGAAGKKDPGPKK